MRPGHTNVHLVIPTHNRPRLLRLLLESLVLVAKPKEGVKIEVTIVENGSSIAKEMVESFSTSGLPMKYRYIEQGNKSAALNAVVDTVAPDTFLLFFDDDVIASPHIIADYLSAVRKFGRPHFYGGPVEGYYDSNPPAYLLKHLPESAGSFMVDGIDQNPTDISSIRSTMLGANWGVYAGVLQSVGAFDPQVGPGSKEGIRGQETDAMRRLVAKGITPIYVPSAEVKHYVPDKVLTEKWLADRFTKTFFYAGSNRRTVPIISREVARLGVSYAAMAKSKITGSKTDRVYATISAAKSKGFFRGLGLPWLTAGLK